MSEPEKIPPEIDECQHISYHLPQWDKKGKCSWDVQLQHKSLNAKAICIKPPTKVIPVIFIPGIMGTNLKNRYTNEPVWNAEWAMGIDTTLLISKNGMERRELLNPDSTIIDNRNIFNPTVHTNFSDNDGLFPSRHDRHWGEALSLSYGEFLATFQYALIDDWQKDITNMVLKHKATSAQEYLDRSGILSNLVGKMLGDTNDAPLTPDELTHFKHFLFPVHVFGYNWLVDNAISASELMVYIDEVLETYKSKHGYGLAIEKVILVTHSMGGLVARYAMNPPESTTLKGCQDKVLGVVHGVIPDLGSPAAYRRMKTGAGKEGIPGKVLGATAEKLMPVLARAPAALQLLPYPKYKSPWLIIEGEGEYPKISDDPQQKQKDPFTDIYLRQDVWWKLYKPDIIDSDKAKIESNWNEYSKLMRNKVQKFIAHQEKGLYHHNTYVFYGNKEKTDGFLTWQKVAATPPITLYSGQVYTPKVNPKNMQPDREIGTLLNGQFCEFILAQSDSAGDGTVPIESLEAIKNSPMIKSILATNVEHQSAYAMSGKIYSGFSDAIQFTLRSIIKIVQEVDIRAAN